MSSDNEFDEEIEKDFEEVKNLLETMISDRAVPRNIKRVAQKGVKELHNREDSPGVVSSNVMYMVDDIAQDPNIPFHARTTIYRILSILENIRD